MAPTAILPTDPKLLAQMNAELLQQLEKSRRTEKQLRSRIDELLRKLYGRRSEKIDPNQLLIDLGALGITPELEASEEEEPAPAPAKPKRKAKRRRPAKDLPRRRIEHELCEAERLCPCCQVPMAKIREELSEQLDYHPATLEVLEHVRFVYGCAKGCDEAVHTAPKPPQMIEKSVAGAGLLAHVVTSKYADHCAPRRRAQPPGGNQQFLWRAVDQDGDTIDILVQPRRDKRAAKRFFRKLLKAQGDGRLGSSLISSGATPQLIVR